MENTAGKAIITVVGKDTVGIIAKICTYLANNRDVYKRQSRSRIGVGKRDYASGAGNDYHR